MKAHEDQLRDPVWTSVGAIAAIVGVVVAIASVILTLLIYVKPKLSATAIVPKLPELYRAETPGPGCDDGGARWTLKEGKVTCAGERAAYEDAFVFFSWPGRAFAPSYEITLHADAWGPDTCVIIVVRGGYGLGTCASGVVGIYRLRSSESSEPIALATKTTREFTKAQIMARVEGQKITLTVFADTYDDGITLTVTDDAFGSADWLAIDVGSKDDAATEKASLYGFQYRAIS